MKIFLAAKIQGLIVTGKGLDYPGSVTVDQTLLNAASIEEHEKVLVVDLNNGERWETYAISGPADSGVFELNGGSARLGEIGDTCMIMTFEIGQKAVPRVVNVDSENRLKGR